MTAIEQLKSGLTIGHFGLGIHGNSSGTPAQQTHDGDTVSVRGLGNFSVRFLAIDTPEISFPLPDAPDHFISIGDSKWKSFLEDPFAPQYHPLDLDAGLTADLKNRLGTGAAANHNMPDIELQRAQYHYPLDYIIPRSGTPVVTDGIAILAKANNARAATEFYEFVTTRDSLVLAARKYFRIPCRKDISPSELPEWMIRNPIPAMEVDWKVLEEKSNEWMRYWDTNIRNSSTK